MDTAPSISSLIYLDNNATTQPAGPVVDAMTQVLREQWGNPSSVHRFGQLARQRVELARSAVARLIGAREREIVFTSGGTEANNLALRGVLAMGRSSPGAPAVLITDRIEHSAIREPAAAVGEAGVEVVYLPVSRDGLIAPSALEAALREHSQPAGAGILVSIQWANNETGVVQPVNEFATVIQAARGKATSGTSGGGAGGSSGGITFHVDATQAVGKLPVDVKAVGVDLLTLSAHKFHGPKGAGALYVRSGVRLVPQLKGGPQERDRRGGTENTAGIVGMGVAAELAAAFVVDSEKIAALAALRDRFEGAILEALPDTVVNSGAAPRLWNTSNLGFPRLEAEAILLGLSEQGVCASAGAACSSGSLEPSPVLLAMGIAEPVAHGSLRFSLSRHSSADEIDRAVPIVLAVVRRLARSMPAGV